jgi:hypothetical protein
MLKKIALSALFAITLSVGIGAARPANAATHDSDVKGFCAWGCPC